MNNAKYDIIVFGATSFVGQILSQYLIDLYGINGKDHQGKDTQEQLSWAIAGRSESKLQQLKQSLSGHFKGEVKDHAQNLPMIIADASSASDMELLCQQCQVVISTVGPYALYGSNLVKACVESGTDYCDLTGEAQWVKSMIDAHENTAKASGARIVHCCGFDSIPSDMGVYYLQQQAKEQVGEQCAEIKMRVKAAKGGASGGTIASILNVVKEASNSAELRAELQDPYSICPVGTDKNPKQKSIHVAEYDNDAKAWVAPFIMAAVNERVVLRSNSIMSYSKKFLYNEGILTSKGIKGALISHGLVIIMGLFMISLMIRPIRWLLEKFVLPKPGEGPSPKAQLAGFFDIHFYGKTEQGKCINTRVTGDRDPGYGSTAKMLGQAGVCLALDISKEEKEGGFWTTSTIFDQRFIDRLEKHSGLKFEHL